MENSFLKEFKNREYFNQCTNFDELELLMSKKKVRAYIGFDCTAKSLHVGSLLQIMILRLLQKHQEWSYPKQGSRLNVFRSSSVEAFSHVIQTRGIGPNPRESSYDYLQC